MVGLHGRQCYGEANSVAAWGAVNVGLAWLPLTRMWPCLVPNETESWKAEKDEQD